MPPSSSSESLTALLAEVADGSAGARDLLWERVYPELKKMARRELRRRRPGQTLQTTALVHEVYFRLVDQTQAGYNDRVHFYAVAATAMRHVIIDYARKKNREKRGGGNRPLPLDEAAVIAEDRAASFLALDEELSRLSALDERMGRVVECRFFGGMTEKEIGHLLGVTERTVRSDWRKARAWLLSALADTPANGNSPTDRQ